MDDWSDTLNPGAITGYGGAPTDQGSGGLVSGLASSVVTRSATTPPLYSPDNPVFWVGALLLAAGGFLAISTHARLGPFKASAAV
jgi:hypothetical protein